MNRKSFRTRGLPNRQAGAGMLVAVLLLALAGVSMAVSNSLTNSPSFAVSSDRMLAQAGSAGGETAGAAAEGPEGRIEEQCKDGHMYLVNVDTRQGSVIVDENPLGNPPPEIPCIVWFCTPPLSPGGEAQCSPIDKEMIETAKKACIGQPRELVNACINGEVVNTFESRMGNRLNSDTAVRLYDELNKLNSSGTYTGEGLENLPGTSAISDAFSVPQEWSGGVVRPDGEDPAGVFGSDPFGIGRLIPPEEAARRDATLGNLDLSRVGRRDVPLVTSEADENTLFGEPTFPQPLRESTFPNSGQRVPTTGSTHDPSRQPSGGLFGNIGNTARNALGGILQGLGGALANMFGGGQSGPGGSGAQQRPGGQPQGGQQQLCRPQYSCNGNTLTFRSSSCRTENVQTCPFGCDGNACQPQRPATQQPDNQDDDPDDREESRPAMQAQLTCAPGLVDIGTDVSVSWSCRNADDARGTGFDTGGLRVGSVSTSTAGTLKDMSRITFRLSCLRGSEEKVAQCPVEVNRSFIVAVANPNPIASGESVNIGWVTGGMSSCTVTGLASGISKSGLSGVLTTPALTEAATIKIRCATRAGGTKESDIGIEIGTSTATSTGSGAE